jgi:hypothetical protein
MLVETQYLSNSKKLVVSYVDKTGDIKLKYFSWDNPMKYVSCEDNDPQRHPTFRSWDGKSVKQIEVNHPDRYAIYEFLDALPEHEKEEERENRAILATRERVPLQQEGQPPTHRKKGEWKKQAAFYLLLLGWAL